MGKGESGRFVASSLPIKFPSRWTVTGTPGARFGTVTGVLPWRLISPLPPEAADYCAHSINPITDPWILSRPWSWVPTDITTVGHYWIDDKELSLSRKLTDVDKNKLPSAYKYSINRMFKRVISFRRKVWALRLRLCKRLVKYMNRFNVCWFKSLTL